MAPFTLPKTPLGNFVKAHYAAPQRQRVFRQLRSKGFTPPTTGRPATGPTAAQRTQLPLDLIGVEGVRRFRRPPRLNPNDWVVQQNDAGTYFASPRTELTGFGPDERRMVKGFDQETSERVPGIQSAYRDLGTSLTENADQTKTRLAALGAGIQAAPLVAGPSGQGVADVDAQLADARRQELAAQASVAVGQMSALPAIAAQ